MKAKVLISSCFDGSKTHKVGDEIDTDSEFVRRLLINGGAEPADEAAEALLANKRMVERFTNPDLKKAFNADIKAQG